MKLQNRYFLNNEVSVNAFIKELNDYRLLYFEDLREKEKFIKWYNKLNTNKHRKALIEKICNIATTIKTNMYKVGEFIRMIDTIQFAPDGKFNMANKEDYLYGVSKFNKKK